jgi:hypothetical protein
MPAQLCQSPKFARMFSLIVLTFSLVFLACSAEAQAQTTWTVTITATHGTTKLKYDYASTPPNAPNCAPSIPIPAPSGKDLYICSGDKVQWMVVTQDNGSTKKSNKLTIFQEDWILLDDGGDPTEGFEATDGVPTTGGTTDGKAAQGSHKYHASIYDKAYGDRYHDDPTIIIGGKLVDDLQIILGICSQLPSAIHLDHDLDEGKRNIVIDQAKKACTDFKNINNQLKTTNP